jgi:hypothetical protein
LPNLKLHQYQWRAIFPNLMLAEVTMYTVCIIPSGAVASRGLYAETVWPFHIIDLNCTGVEMEILECSHNGLFDEYNCPSRNDASLRCQSMISH